MLLAFGDRTRQAISAGDHDAMLRGLASLAALWFELAESSISARPHVRFANVLNEPLLAAACDLYDLLELSPQGRKALFDLVCNPVVEQTKSK